LGDEQSRSVAEEQWRREYFARERRRRNKSWFASIRSTKVDRRSKSALVFILLICAIAVGVAYFAYPSVPVVGSIVSASFSLSTSSAYATKTMTTYETVTTSTVLRCGAKCESATTTSTVVYSSSYMTTWLKSESVSTLSYFSTRYYTELKPPYLFLGLTGLSNMVFGLTRFFDPTVIIPVIVAVSILLGLYRYRKHPNLIRSSSIARRFFTAMFNYGANTLKHIASYARQQSRKTATWLLDELKQLANPKLRWETSLRDAYRNERWTEAQQIYRDHGLSSSPSATMLIELINTNLNKPSVVFVDVETDPATGRVWELGAFRTRGSAVLRDFHAFVRIDSQIPKARLKAEELAAYENSPSWEETKTAFAQFVGNTQYLAGHNIRFDVEHIADTVLSSKTLIDTLELGFLTWPTRFSHSLSELSGKDEKHRGLEDARTSHELFLSIFESLQKMSLSRRAIVTGACRDQDAQHFLSDALEVPTGTFAEIHRQLGSVIAAERDSMEKRFTLNEFDHNDLSNEIEKLSDSSVSVLLLIDGATDSEETIKSCLVCANQDTIATLHSPYDLPSARTIASRMNGFECAIPQITVSSRRMSRLCPFKFTESAGTFAERNEMWRRAFLAIALWVMDSPECYVEEFSQWLRHDDEWANLLLIELSQHSNQCPENCGFTNSVSSKLLLCDATTIYDFKRKVIVPSAHRLESIITDGRAYDLSSRKIRDFLRASQTCAVDDETRNQVSTCGSFLEEVTSLVVRFVRNRDLRIEQDPDRATVRILDFYANSSDWLGLAKSLGDFAKSLTELAQMQAKTARKELSSFAKRILEDITRLLNGDSNAVVRWLTFQRVEAEFDWTYRDAPIDVRTDAKRLLEQYHTVLVTDSVPGEEIVDYLLSRWGVVEIRTVHCKAIPRSKILSLTFLPRPTRLNVRSFLSTLIALTVPLTNSLHQVEFSVHSRTFMSLLSRVLRRALPEVPVISRTDNLSRRRAISRASHESSKDEPFALIDQTFLIRKKERRISTKVLLLERLPLPSVADPVSAARLEASGSGIDGYEGYVLPETAINLTEIASYGGASGATGRTSATPIVVCDTRFKSLGAALTELLHEDLQWCDTPSALASALSLPENTLSNYDEQAKTMSELVKKVMTEAGLIHESDLSRLIDPTTYLRAIFGHDSFRESQEAIIKRILRKEDAFVVMPTGYGKSVCYQIPAIAFSLAEEGLTLILTPLQALMRDQVQSLHRQGIFRATYINASLTPVERSQRLRGIRYGWYNLVYLAPEQLRNSQTLEAIRSREISLMVIDEAHCLSQWGHDFRPDYMNAADFLNSLPSRPVVAAFTATATEQVALDAKKILGIQADPVRLSPRRKNIELKTIIVDAKSSREADVKKKEALLNTLRDHKEQNGIIYCAFTRTTEEIASFLKDHSDELGISTDEIAFFHGKLPDQDKAEIQDKFVGKAKTKAKPIKLVVSTNAFGLGIDKGDIHFIVHYDIPGSLESYYQEVGRAGRDPNLEAIGILLFAETDLDKQRLLFRYVDEKDIAHLHENLLKISPAPDGMVYVSDSDLARDTGLDEITVRVALYQLEKHRILLRGPNAFPPAILKLASHKRLRGVAANSDREKLLGYLKVALSKSEWQTIYPEKAAKELGWDPSRLDSILKLLLHEESSGVIKQRELQITFDDPQGAPRDVEAFYDEQIRLVNELGMIFPELNSGGWVNIRGELWPRLLRAVQPSGRLSRVDCAKYLRMWSDLRLVWHKEELSRDSLRLTIPRDKVRETLEECKELDARLVKRLAPTTGKKSTVDLGSFADLGRAEEIDDSIRRLAELGVIAITRLATTSGMCMSLTLLRKEAITPSDLDLAALKKFQRDREYKLEVMNKYAELTTNEDRWRFIEDYFAGKIARSIRSDIVHGLNVQQVEAVTSPAGYQLINAGAGTGKTETVARRILYVNEELGIPAGQILAMTFSRSGVAQLRERMKRIMPNCRIDIRTYHSLCFEILQSHAGEAPLWIRPGFEVDSTESLMGRIRHILDNLQDGLEIQERVGVYSKAIQKLLSLREPPQPSDIGDKFELEIDQNTLDGESLRKAYSAYIEVLKKSNTIDFSFMIALTVQLLRSRPEVVRDYERRVAYLVVDEYQDTTPIQDELLSLLSGWYRNLCVVGDSDQTIFAWSNADIRNILDFKERRPKARQINLEINYRSTQNILNVANQCIQHNQERIPKTLKSARKINGPTVTIHYADGNDELGATHICETIKRKIAEGTPPEDIAVLVKTNDQLAKLLETMRSFGIHVNTPEAHDLLTANQKVRQALLVLGKVAAEQPQLSAFSAYANLLNTIKGLPQGFDEFVREFDQNSEDNSVLAFLNLVKATTSQDSRLARNNAVNLMTIHKAKGLEYRTVFVTFLRAGSFPRFDTKIEEERRVFYVALTRAKDELFAMAPYTRISKFIKEIAVAQTSITESGDTLHVERPQTARVQTVHAATTIRKPEYRARPSERASERDRIRKSRNIAPVILNEEDEEYGAYDRDVQRRYEESYRSNLGRAPRVARVRGRLDGSWITVKYSNYCVKCSKLITEGEKALWSEGVGIWHGNCRK
jgi:RecQ family ATP-dependent DNA helicase